MVVNKPLGVLVDVMEKHRDVGGMEKPASLLVVADEFERDCDSVHSHVEDEAMGGQNADGGSELLLGGDFVGDAVDLVLLSLEGVEHGLEALSPLGNLTHILEEHLLIIKVSASLLEGLHFRKLPCHVALGWL